MSHATTITHAHTNGQAQRHRAVGKLERLAVMADEINKQVALDEDITRAIGNKTYKAMLKASKAFQSAILQAKADLRARRDS